MNAAHACSTPTCAAHYSCSPTDTQRPGAPTHSRSRRTGGQECLQGLPGTSTNCFFSSVLWKPAVKNLIFKNQPLNICMFHPEFSHYFDSQPNLPTSVPEFFEFFHLDAEYEKPTCAYL